MKRVIVLAGLMMLSGVAHSAKSDPAIKKSLSGICHTVDSPYYTKTKNFTGYDTLSACVESGGRAIKPSAKKMANKPSESSGRPKYSRDMFPHWIDEDKDCQNLRHELLIRQSGEKVTFTRSNRCYVATGSWVDPYSGKVFHTARNVHIDHVVPLYFAYLHGATEWSKEKRTQFANDPENLLVVSGELNEEKGAKGLDQWLPPNDSYKCKYAHKFIDVSVKYGIKLTQSEVASYKKTLKDSCE
ncbi:HNH endonuclease family protein [Vibrio owensii]|uniref:HNH endonuclease family protein n=1 Tax=Vibrio harveyi group TaxID=717610 RepID=UPI003CC52A30